MASCSVPEKKAEAESPMFPNWLDLPRDITVNILRRVGTFKLLTSVCQVCPLWWKICKDPLIWRSINMSNFMFSKYPLVKMCCNAIERSCGHLEDIVVGEFATDDILECIANNASNLQRMTLSCSPSISEKGFVDAVRNLSRLETLDISLLDISKDSLEVVGRSCPLLKSLKFAKLFFNIGFDDDDVAFVIGKSLSGLCHLCIDGYNFTNDGLLAIIDGCPLLETLDIKECDILDLSRSLKKRCLEKIKIVRLPN